MALQLDTSLVNRIVPLSEYQQASQNRQMKQRASEMQLQASEEKAKSQAIARDLSYATPENWQAVRPALVRHGVPDEFLPAEYNEEWKNKVISGLGGGDANPGGATGYLTDRLMKTTGMSYPDALYQVQTGYRQNMQAQNGQLQPMRGAVDAKQQLKYGETMGSQAAKLDTEPTITAAKTTAENLANANSKPTLTASEPLPMQALKAQNDALDAIGLASGINADLGSFADQIDTGKLQLGLGENLVSAGRNFVGKSDENSRNYASFRSTLEKLRNDTLRLNNGVQTEGDATRAWHELLANINDQELVRQRLGEIQRINERAVELQKQKISSIRSNYGKDDYDYSGMSVKSAIEPDAPPKTIQPGDIEDGYRFKGGNPADPNSWEPAQ